VPAREGAKDREHVFALTKLLVVVNLDSGSTVATLPVGAGTDSAAFDPTRKLIFSSNGREGTLSIIQEADPQTYLPLPSVKTAVSARTMDIDPGVGKDLSGSR
jgi:DNA-binding beta-propeller fold protein YncE